MVNVCSQQIIVCTLRSPQFNAFFVETYNSTIFLLILCFPTFYSTYLRAKNAIFSLLNKIIIPTSCKSKSFKSLQTITITKT